MNIASAQSGKTLSTSMFYMWRCVIAIAHADGMIHEGERAYLQKVFAGMGRAFGLTDDQKSTFATDLEKAQKIGDLLPYINEPAARAQLIYFGGLLARADGELSPSEDSILKKLHADQMAALDLEQIRADVKKAVADQTFRHDLDVQSIRPQSGLSGLLDRFLIHLGIDLLS